MNDREMLLLAYGAVKANPYSPPGLIQMLEQHLFGTEAETSGTEAIFQEEVEKTVL